MDPRRLNEFRSRLEEEARRLESMLNRMETGQLEHSLGKSIGELSTYDNHPADVGSETFERGKDIALEDMAQRNLTRVRHALNRVDEGTYGFCENCGRSIHPNRLTAIPETEHCIICASTSEGKRESGDDMTHRRPVEEDVLEPPFHPTPGHELDETETVEYDAEDTWQAVARWGTSNTPGDVGGGDDANRIYIDSDEPIGYVSEVENESVDGEDEDDEDEA